MDRGVAIIGNPHNKFHYVDKQGKPLCGTKTGSTQLFGDTWYKWHMNAWLTMKDLIKTYGEKVACQKCWKRH